MSVLGARSVHIPKTAELVAQDLRRRIVTGELSEGDALPNETDLMGEFGISRPTLREAFRILESERLISIRRGARGGARVHPPDEMFAARHAGLVLQHRGATLEDVFRVRLVVESPAARMLAEAKDPDVIARLDANLDQAEAAIGKPTEASKIETDFHRLVIEATGSPTMSVLVSIVHGIIEEAGILRAAGESSEAEGRGGTKRALKAHRRFVELVKAGDADGAEELWRRHLDEGSRYVLEGIKGTRVLDLFE